MRVGTRSLRLSVIWAVSVVVLVAVSGRGSCQAASPLAEAEQAPGQAPWEVTLSVVGDVSAQVLPATFVLAAGVTGPPDEMDRVQQVAFYRLGPWHQYDVLLGVVSKPSGDALGRWRYLLALRQETPGHVAYQARALHGRKREVVRSHVKELTFFWPNGIVVREVEIYDERALERRLADVVTALSAAQFPNPSGLYNAVGQFQGGRASSASQSLLLQTVPTPSLSTTTATGSTASKATASGTETKAATPVAAPAGTTTVTTTDAATGLTETVTTSSSDTKKSETTASTSQTTKADSVSPAFLPAPGQISPFTFQPSYGLSAQDLLIGQTDLQYQLINLQMLLERSITDRVYQVASASDGKARSYPRAQPVLGFEISLDPTKAYRNAVAEVEITIAPDARTPGEQKPPSVIAMMPQSKTYNVATVSQKSSAVGLGIVAGIVNAGFTSGSASQTLYLVKDIDTVALAELPPAPADLHGRSAVRFAWQFRPVLGQKTVQPGIRQVMVVLGLPTDSGTPWAGTVFVTTRWRALASDRVTVGDTIAGSESYQTPMPLVISPAYIRAKTLQTTNSVILEDVGGGNVAVTALGTFEPGTVVNLGPRVLDSGPTGLVMSSTGRIKFVASADELMRNIPLLVDRYGTALRVVDPNSYDISGNETPTLHMDNLTVERIDDAMSRVTARLYLTAAKDGDVVYAAPELGHDPKATPEGRAIGRSQPGDTSDPSVLLAALKADSADPSQHRQLHSHAPVVLIGGQVFGLSNAPVRVRPWRDRDHLASCSPLDQAAEPTGTDVRVTFCVPTQLLTQARVLTVQDLLWGDRYRAKAVLPLPLTVTKATPLSGDTVMLVGTGLDDAVVRVGGADGACGTGTRSPQLAVLKFPGGLHGAKHLFVQDPGGAGAPLVVPIEAPAKPAPLPVTNQEDVKLPIFLYPGDLRTIRLIGTNLDSIKAITLGEDEWGNDVSLPIHPDPEKKNAILVSVPAVVTKTPGRKEPKIVLTDGRVAPPERILWFIVKETRARSD
jgi:hypothetical protein